MFRSLVCVTICVAIVGAETVFAAAPQISGTECRLAEQRAKRLRRLSNRTGTIHFAPSVEHDGTVVADDHPPMPNSASEPTWLNAAGGWNGSGTTEHSPDDGESAAALFPTRASGAEAQ
jgi:hypothetical protein